MVRVGAVCFGCRSVMFLSSRTALNPRVAPPSYARSCDIACTPHSRDYCLAPRPSAIPICRDECFG